MTNSTGVTTGLEQNVDYILRKGLKVEKIFSPEHGFYSTFAPGEEVPDENYRGIPAKSLYKEKSKEIDRSEIEELDCVLFGLQDAGVRFYTYLSTVRNLLQASKDLPTRIVVLDRPNPIRSDIVEGPILDERNISFVGTDTMPSRYGMTIGEVARFFDRNIGSDPLVSKIDGYGRRSYYDGMVNFFVPFSWNLPVFSSVLNYTGICFFFEATDVSVGRGTPYPVQKIGHEDLWYSIHMKQTGITMRKTEFTTLIDPCKDNRVQGYYVHITDKENYSPLNTWLKIIYELGKDGKCQIREKWLRLLYASDEMLKATKEQTSFSEIEKNGKKTLRNSERSDQDICFTDSIPHSFRGTRLPCISLQGCFQVSPNMLRCTPLTLAGYPYLLPPMWTRKLLHSRLLFQQ